MAETQSSKLFLVQRINWFNHEILDDGIFIHAGDEDSGMPIRAFTDYAKADQFRQSAEAKRRLKANPFNHGNPYGGIEGVSSLDADRFHDWLMDAGLEPPDDSRKWKLAAWSQWWNKSKRHLSDYQKAKIWEALDKVCFYNIVEFDADEG